MAAGNFDSPLTIVAGFVQWPTGPLFPSDGETMVRVEVWIMQHTTGAIQMTFERAGDFPVFPIKWHANRIWYPNAPWGAGLFKPGPALGTAVAISTKGANQYYYWWSQEVQLEL